MAATSFQQTISMVCEAVQLLPACDMCCLAVNMSKARAADKQNDLPCRLVVVAAHLPEESFQSSAALPGEACKQACNILAQL